MELIEKKTGRKAVVRMHTLNSGVLNTNYEYEFFNGYDVTVKSLTHALDQVREWAQADVNRVAFINGDMVYKRAGE